MAQMEEETGVGHVTSLAVKVKKISEIIVNFAPSSKSPNQITNLNSFTVKTKVI